MKFSMREGFLLCLCLGLITTMMSTTVLAAQRGGISPFTGEYLEEMHIRKALMVVIDNSPQSRPQSGLEEASIVYEALVEGGLTRFLALYWDQIPNEIGPVRSARPYLIDIAGEYNAVLLHAGACPDGFAMLQQGGITHLDQIYSDSYYWRSTEREAPNNLYTGNSTIVNYLEEVIGQEYNNRFPFKKLNITGPEEQYADIIRIPYWGGTMVSYRYDSNENKYYRYYGFIETPHILANNKQITASNIIVQYVKTQQKDNVGRLILDLKNRGRAQIFTGGIVVEGYWERDSYGVTRYYNNQGERIGLNPGQTWINLALDTIDVEYKDTRVVSDIN